MQIRHMLVGGLLVLGLGVGCDASKDIEKMADKACACKDKDCAKKSVEEFVSWVNSHKDARGDEKKAENETKRLLECAQKAGLSQTDLAEVLKKMDI
jgi:hypothetical protein